MNCIFIVEGTTEKRVLKHWIPHLKNHLRFVQYFHQLTNDSFTIISGKGYPYIFKIIKNVFEDIYRYNNVSKLFICVDLDDEEINPREKLNTINNFIENNCRQIDIEINIIIQNHCFETWLMGNKQLDIGEITDEELMQYRDFYNVNVLDPEFLNSIDERPLSRFIYRYFQLMMEENNHTYTKVSTAAVSTHTFLFELIRRFREDQHIQSFEEFIDKVNNI